MDTNLSGEAIWEALQAETAIMEDIPVQAHDTWQECCMAVAPVLQPLADLPVNAENFVRAKFEVLRFFRDGEWLQKILGAYPEEAFPLGMKTMFESVVSMLESLLPQLEEMLGSVNEVLESHGMSEEEFLAHETGGRFNLISLELWRAGNFTIGDLMVYQPSALFRND